MLRKDVDAVEKTTVVEKDGPMFWLTAAPSAAEGATISTVIMTEAGSAPVSRNEIDT